jgi:hypothetical protein
MKLEELYNIIRSRTNNIQWVIVWSAITHNYLEYGCSVEYALDHYGECEAERIYPFYDRENFTDYLVIEIK